MKNIIKITDQDFQEKVIEQSKKIPVVVDFYADWCGACQVLLPVIEKVAKDYKDKFILVEVNVDGAPSTAEEYGVMSIPSVKLFKDGKIVDEFLGALPEPQIKEWAEKNL